MCACLGVRAFALSNGSGAPTVDTSDAIRSTNVARRNAASTPVAGTLCFCLSLFAVWFRNATSWQHPGVFPGSPPPHYEPGFSPLNFGGRKGSGAFGAVWPPAITSAPFLCLFGFSALCWGVVCGVYKAGSTLRSSRAVPHPSTNRALRRLTSEVGRDPVHSTRYGRQR